MEYNKNKIIFWIIWVILLLFTVIFILTLDNEPANKSQTSTWWNFTIWTIWDNSSDFSEIITDFKTKNPKYKNKAITVESFYNYEEYTYSLISAINKWKAPDIFVLNNNENKSIFSEQTIWINPDVINPNDFRKKYKSIFSDDLISSVEVEWKQKEYLTWIPVWYETLGIYYNIKHVRSSDLKNISTLENWVIQKLKKKYPDLIPIAIWNWTTVEHSADIVTQFLMLEPDVKSLSDINSTIIKQALGKYLMFWDSDWDNHYNSRYVELKNLWEKWLYLFARWDAFMLVWYPRKINEINAKWYPKTYLQASPFPHYFSWNWRTLANYNYFVANKKSTEQELAFDFMSYLSTETWASKFLKTYPYYLPALLSLESEKLEEKIHKDYNVVLKDFYNDDFELSSFDKWIKNIYDRDLEILLDNSSTYLSSFEIFKNSILCKTNKVLNLTKFSTQCE